MPPSTPVEAAPLSGIAAAGTQPAEAAASNTISTSQTPQLSPTATAAPAPVSSAAAPVEASAAARQLEADTATLFGVPIAKLPTFIPPSSQLVPRRPVNPHQAQLPCLLWHQCSQLRCRPHCWACFSCPYSGSNPSLRRSGRPRQPPRTPQTPKRSWISLSQAAVVWAASRQLCSWGIQTAIRVLPSGSTHVG